MIILFLVYFTNDYIQSRKHILYKMQVSLAYKYKIANCLAVQPHREVLDTLKLIRKLNYMFFPGYKNE